ncbi:hypothetical protein [Pseudoruminococcus massiliensis]
MPTCYLCQWISYAVFAAVAACCVPVSHADALTRSACKSRKCPIEKVQSD